jgi:hypothetical protein
MCLMFYVASEAGIPVCAEPAIHVDLVEPERKDVRKWFSLPEVRFVGAHTGCSCGFPSVQAHQPVEYYDGIFDGDEDREKDLASVRALLALVHEELERSNAVELRAVWAGDEWERPAGVIHVAASQLDPERFFFNEHFLYRVTRERPAAADAE